MKYLRLFVAAALFLPDYASAQVAPLISNPAPQQFPAPSVKKTRTIFLDIPILPMRKTINIRRIKEASLGLGSTLQPWGENIIQKINIAPEFTVAGSDYRLTAIGGYVKSHDKGQERSGDFIDISLDRKVWKLSAGLAGFTEGERVKDIFQAIDLMADFSRSSVGIKSWGGFKAGSFSGDFFVLNTGMGYIRTDGNFDYRHPVLRDLDSFRIYQDDFKVYTAAAEGQKTNSRLSAHMKFEGVAYRGSHSFEDLNIRGNLQILPFTRLRSISFVARGNYNFKKYDSLLIRTGEPEFQVYLRVKIK